LSAFCIHVQTGRAIETIMVFECLGGMFNKQAPDLSVTYGFQMICEAPKMPAWDELARIEVLPRCLQEGIKGSLVEALLPRQQIRDGELDMATSRHGCCLHFSIIITTGNSDTLGNTLAKLVLGI
jgi:hypothetical protein